MKTLVQAIAEHRGEVERVEREKQAEREREKQRIKAIEFRGHDELMIVLQQCNDFEVRELNWQTQFVTHESTETTHVFRFSFTVKNGHGRVELEDRCAWSTEYLTWSFTDPHNRGAKREPSQLTWRDVINETYGFSHTLIEAVSRIAPKSWTESDDDLPNFDEQEAAENGATDDDTTGW